MATLLCRECRPAECADCTQILGLKAGDVSAGPICVWCALKRGFISGDLPAWYKRAPCSYHGCGIRPVYQPPVWQICPTTEVTEPKLAAARASFADLTTVKEGHATNPHCIAAAMRVVSERQVADRVDQLSQGRPGAPRMLLVGVGPRQDVAALRRSGVALLAVGPTGVASPDPADVVRLGPTGHSVGGRREDFWSRVDGWLQRAGAGDYAVFYNTAYYAPASTLALLDRAVRLGAHAFATGMLPPPPGSGFLRPAAFVPALAASTSPHLLEGVIIRDGDRMQVFMSGNSGSYEHPVLDRRWVVLRDNLGMASLMFSPNSMEAATTPQSGSWVDTASGRVWWHNRINVKCATLERTREAVAGVLAGSYRSAKPLPLELVPHALNVAPIDAVAAVVADALHVDLGTVDSVVAGAVAVRSPVVNQALAMFGVEQWLEIAWVVSLLACGAAPLPPSSAAATGVASIAAVAVAVVLFLVNIDRPLALAWGLVGLYATRGGWPVGWSSARRSTAVRAASFAYASATTLSTLGAGGLLGFLLPGLRVTVVVSFIACIRMRVALFALWTILHIAGRSSDPVPVGRSAAIPAFLCGIKEGIYEHTSHHMERSVTIARDVVAAISRGKKGFVNAAGYAILVAANNIAPYITYKTSSGPALIARGFVDGPDETDESVADSEREMQGLEDRLELSREDAVAFVEEHARKFTGAKCLQYQSVAEFLRSGVQPSGVWSYYVYVKSLTATILSMRMFTKTEITACRGPGELGPNELTGDYTANALEEAVCRANGKPKPRMVCFPGYHNNAAITVLAPIVATHYIIKQMLNDMWRRNVCLNPAMDLSAFADQFMMKLRALYRLPVRHREFTAMALRRYRDLGHNDELMERPHVLGSSFCSKVVFPCRLSSDGQPTVAFVIPLHRLFPRMLTIVTVTPEDAPNVMAAKLDCLSDIMESSAFGTRLLQAAYGYLDRLGAISRDNRHFNDYTNAYNVAGSRKPPVLEVEREFWRLAYGADFATFEEECGRLERLLADAPVTPVRDRVYGITTRLQPIELSREHFPLFNKWLMPGATQVEREVVEYRVRKVANGALAGDAASVQEVLDIANNRGFVRIADRAGRERGLLKNDEVARSLGPACSNREVAIMVGAGRSGVVDIVRQTRSVIAIEVGQAYDDLKLDAHSDNCAIDFDTQARSFHGIKCRPEEWSAVLTQLRSEDVERVVLWSDAPIASAACPGVELEELNRYLSDLIEANFSVTATIKISQSHPWSCVRYTGTDPDEVDIDEVFRPVGARAGSAECYVRFEVSEAHSGLAFEPCADPETLAVKVIASNLLQHADVYQGITRMVLLDGDAIVGDRNEYERLADAAGLTDLNQYRVFEADAASCDGRQGRRNALIQRRLLRIAGEVFPELDVKSALAAVFGPVSGDDGSHGRVASLEEDEAMLYSGLPWTTFVNGKTFTQAIQGAVSEAVPSATQDEALKYVATCSTGDDLASIVLTDE